MDAQATSWIAFGIATVTMVGGLVKSMIDSRDKKFNSEQAVRVALLEVKSGELEKDHKECMDNHEVTKTKLEECEEAHKETDRRLIALEAVVKPGPA